MAEHPERFLAWPHPWPPFPSYSFNGPNLSQTRASACTWRTTTGTGRTPRSCSSGWTSPRGARASSTTATTARTCRGTTRPSSTSSSPRPGRRSSRPSSTWPACFPIIRFDAAMTLAKKHFQRLWYPEPGRGGDIPSRAGNGDVAQRFRPGDARGVLARGGGQGGAGAPRTRSSSPRRSGCWRGSSCAPSACTVSTTAPSCTC